MDHFADGDYFAARQILDRLNNEGIVAREFPSAPFYYLLGASRSRTGDPSGALEALDHALAIDRHYEPALEEKARVIQGENR